jgi:putative transposase
MLRKVPFAPGEYYHIYNRGVEKRDIFLDSADYDRFIRLLYLTNGDKPVVFRLVQGLPLDEIEVGEKRAALGAYVLMKNHFHILVKEIRTGGITGFMEKLQTAYSMYFNKKYQRVGSLFQGTFKSQHISADEHLRYLFAYIHLNPIKQVQADWKIVGIKDVDAAKRHLAAYPYSSYAPYTQAGHPHRSILAAQEFPEYFLKPQDFIASAHEWLVQGLPLER